MTAFADYRDEETNQTLLHLAVKSGRNDLLEMILPYGRVLLKAANKNGDTALHTAAGLGMDVATEILLSRYTPPNNKAILSQNRHNRHSYVAYSRELYMGHPLLVPSCIDSFYLYCKVICNIMHVIMDCVIRLSDCSSNIFLWVPGNYASCFLMILFSLWWQKSLMAWIRLRH